MAKNNDPFKPLLEADGEHLTLTPSASFPGNFSAHAKQKRLLELIGTLDWDDAYDYKLERNRN